MSRARASLALVLLAAAGACALPAGRAPGEGRPPLAVQGTLRVDATWSGTVIVTGDLHVPTGRTLRILAGTRVLVRPADTTKTEPEFLDNATEVLVRGALLAEGEPGRPVVFEPQPGAEAADEAARWAGIIFDGGSGAIRHARVAGAAAGITLIDASPTLADIVVQDVRDGLVLYGRSAPRVERATVRAGSAGVSCWPGASPVLEEVDGEAVEHEGLLVAPGALPRLRRSTFRGGVSDVLWAAEQAPPPGQLGRRLRRVAPPAAAAVAAPPAPFEPRVPPASGAPTRVYRGEQFIGEDTVWEGEVLVDGTVMVAPVAQLTVAPGAVVRFADRDTDGDGIGESELFVQGRLVAEGTAQAPIVFTSLDPAPAPGRWGAINLMGSDAVESRLAWCLIEGAHRGLHSHFSRFRVEHSIFRRNRRSIQFQESTAVIARTRISASASALRFRDSTAALEELSVEGNTLGIQVLRSTFSLVSSSVLANTLAGLHARESEGTVSGTTFGGNAPGLRASDCRLDVDGSRFVANRGAGLQLRRAAGRVTANRIEDNAGNGVSTDSPGAPLRGNSIVGNLRFAVESNAAAEIDASGNWWGPDGPRPELFFDAADDPALGPIRTSPALAAPPR